MPSEIRAGEVVQLKSGGPHMTVVKVDSLHEVQTAWCDWFDGNKTARSTFPLTSLKVVEEERGARGAEVGLGGGDPSTTWMR